MAVTVAVYGTPLTPLGSDVVVMFRGAAMTSENVLFTVCGFGVPLSVTVIVTELVPAAEAVPVICPVAGSIDNPAGSPVALNVYGATPPAAVTVVL